MQANAAIAAGLMVTLLISGCKEKVPAQANAAPKTEASTAASEDPGLAGIHPASPSPAPPTSSARLAGCRIMPPDNVWHADVSKLPVNSSSRAWVASIGADRSAHPDFGSGLIDGGPFGIPVTSVPSGHPTVKVSFEYGAESDKGPYLIPKGVKVEGGSNASGDRHVIVLDSGACKAYELFAARPNGNGSWTAASGAIFDLRSNALRAAGWTSADAAGLPILPGLARYEDVATGHIDHALRFTAPLTRNSYVWPARHAASKAGDPALPPMGARFRLKASVNTSRFPPQARVIAEALKHYGAILADNGSPWYLTGTEDSRWNNDALNALKTLKGSDFEAVDATRLMANPNSGRCIC
jgi:hypothetical protein